jgi:hypothetical protein
MLFASVLATNNRRHRDDVRQQEEFLKKKREDREAREREIALKRQEQATSRMIRKSSSLKVTDVIIFSGTFEHRN